MYNAIPITLLIDRKIYAVFILILLSSVASFAQPFFPKWEPFGVVSFEDSERWEYSLRAGGLYSMGRAGVEEFPNPMPNRVDIRGFVSYKLFNNEKVTGGYMYRKYYPFDTVGDEHRFVEQYAISLYSGKYRMKHRFSLEQRILTNSFINRLRYRFGVDFPLNGERLDVGEWYLRGSEELVSSFNADLFAVENRFTTGAGWKLQENQKIEFRLQYRYDLPGVEGREQKLHFITAFYFSL